MNTQSQLESGFDQHRLASEENKLLPTIDEIKDYQSLKQSSEAESVLTGNLLDLSSDATLYASVHDVEEEPDQDIANQESTVERLETWHLDEQAETVYERFDQDDDDRLSVDELAAAISDHSLSSMEHQLVAALYRDREIIEQMVEDGGDGISIADIEAVELPASRSSINRAFRWFNHEASKHELSRDDIATALEQPDLNEDQRNALQYLQDNFDSVAGENGVIDKTDLQNLLAGGTTDGITIEETIDRAYNSEIDSGGRLFGDSDNPTASIVPEAVKQGDANNCFFLSAVAALAEQRPQEIHDMITENPDGTYTVIFPGAPDESITVEAPTAAEMGLYALGSEHGTWPVVLEKAYGEYCGRHMGNKGNTIQENAMSREGNLNLGLGVEIMTGSDVDNDVFGQRVLGLKVLRPFYRIEATASKLQEAMENGDIVLARTPGHVAAVRDFDPEGEDGGTLIIYDQDLSERRCSLREFMNSTGHSFTFEQRQAS